MVQGDEKLRTCIRLSQAGMQGHHGSREAECLPWGAGG